MAANQVDFKILPSDQFSVYSPQTRSDKVITYFTLLSKLRGDILSVGQDDDPNDIVSAFYSSVGGTQTLHLVKADGSEVTASNSFAGTVTSVDMSVPTGFSISGNPITTSGTLAVGFASGYSLPTNAIQATWTTAYNRSLTSAAVTGTSTKTLTLNQQNGGTITASWSDIDTGLTSVGLTMPAAFSVANSPLTANGTLAVTAAGLSSQYIRGDGQLANFPSSGGGGSSVNYYLNGSVNQGTFGGVTYYELSKTPISGAGTNFTRAHGLGDGYIASFITDANDPDLINIPGGNWNLEFYFNSSSSGGSPAFYGELYKVSISNVFTLIASGSVNPESITGGTSVDQYYTSIAVPQTALLATDRLAIRVYVIVDGRNITLHTENSNFSEVITTFSTGLNSLNGLSDQVQYFAVGTSGTDFAISSSLDTHTFNLPTASAANRGALSSSDWTTFNGKASDAFKTIAVTGQSDIVADNATDTLNIVAGSGVTLTTNATTDTLTISASGSGGTVTSVGTTAPITGGTITTTGTIGITQSGVSTDGYLSSTDWNTFNNKQSTLLFSGPLVNTSGTVSIPVATTSVSGYLNNTDWTTFNSKQNAITLTTTGTTGAATLIGATLNIPSYADQFVGTVTSVAALTLGTTGTDLSSTVANGTTTPVITLQVPTASAANRGALSSADWTTFNSKQGTITLTTTGTTGAATFISNTLNIPNYADQFVGTVTSVNMSVPTGFAISGNPITTSGTLAVAFAAGYSLPTNASQTTWNTAYNDSITAFAYNTSTAVLTLTQQDAGTLTATVTLQPFTTSNLAEGTNLYYTDTRARLALSAGTGISYSTTTGVITNSAPDLTVVLTGGTGISTSGTYPSFTITNTAPDLTVVLTSSTGISVTGTYPSFTIANTAPDQTVVLTGGTGITTSGTYPSFTVTNSDRGSSQNIFKNIAVAGQSTIVADVNDDTLTVVAGSGVTITTNDTTDTITISATGSGGSVTSVGTTAPITGGTFTTTGTIGITQSGAAADGYLSSTDWATFNSKQPQLNGTGFVKASGTTISYDNNTYYLASNPSGFTSNTGTVTSVGLTGGTGISISGGPITGSGSITVTNSAPDQTVSLTAGTGITTSGTYPSFTVTNSAPDQTVALSAGTGISISGTYPSFTITNTSAGGGTITGSGTANYVPKWTSASAIGNSAIYDNAGNVGIGTTSPGAKLHVVGTVATDSALADVDAYRIIKPNGGVRVTSNSSETGAIKITYPVGFTYTMHRVKLNVYEYTTNESFTIYFGGYTYASDLNWYSEFAYILDNPQVDRNFAVRFGYDGNRAVVYIGELSSNWTYPQIFIEEVELGYSGQSSTWRDGAWVIGFEASAFQSVTRTVTNTQATNWARNGSSAYYGFGNVGIGTTSPTYTLDVSGTARTTTGTYLGTSSGNVIVGGTTSDLIGGFKFIAIGNTAVQYGASTGTYLTIEPGAADTEVALKADARSGAYPPMTLYTSGSERLRITSAGNVGIGTTSPTTKLHISGTTTNITITDTTYGRTSNIGYIDSANLYLANDSSSNTYIGRYNSVFLAYGGGSVGINTTSPSYKLDVNGNVRSNGGLYSEGAHGNTFIQNLLPAANNGAATGDVQLRMWCSEPGITWDWAGFGYNVLNDGAGPYGFGRQNGSFGQAYMRMSTSGDWFFYNTTTANVRSTTMTLTAGGNVGIGTTAPGGRLHIATPDPATNFVAIDFRNPTYGIYGKSNSIGGRGNTLEFTATDFNAGGAVTTRDVLTLRPEGSVGIGTTSPGSYKLSVAGGQFGTLLKGGDLGTGSDVVRMIKSNDSVAMLVRGDGNVGINTTSPDATLRVEGIVSINGEGNGVLIDSGATSVARVGFMKYGGYEGMLIAGNATLLRLAHRTDSTAVYGGTPTIREDLVITAAGNVGIGNNGPSYKLDVTGDARINTGALGVNIAPSATDGRIDASNDIVAFSSSDLRLKENIKPIENALEKVKSLTGVEFDWKPELKHAHGYEGHDTGVIAQEVQEVMPTAIRTNDTGYLAVRYEKLIGLLIEGMKEQQLQIDELKSKLK